MTDEQIKQKAEAYAELLTADNKEHYRTIYTAAKEGYETGAHSCDEEIEELKKLFFEKVCDIQFLEHKLCNPWISVDEQLPKNNVGVLVRREDDFYLYGKFLNGRKWYCYGFGWQDTYKITHWMPIPKVNKEK